MLAATMTDTTNEQGGQHNLRVISPVLVTGIEQHLRQLGQPESWYTSQFAFMFEGREHNTANAVSKLLLHASQTIGTSLGKEHSILVSALDLTTHNDQGNNSWTVVAFSSHGLDGLESERVWASATQRANDDLAALDSPIRLVSGPDLPTQP